MGRHRLAERFHACTYTDQRASEVVCRLSSGRSMRAVCQDADMPSYNTLVRWMRVYPDFATQVAAVRDRSGGRRSPGSAGKRGQYSESLAHRLCRALSAGYSLTEICAHPSIPIGPHCVQAWARKRPDFARLYQAATAPRPTGRGLRIGRGRRGGFTPDLGDEIVARLLQGRSLDAIAHDPDMPCVRLINRWRRRHMDFHLAVQTARRLQLDVLFDKALEEMNAGRVPVGGRRLAAALVRDGYGG